MISPSKDHMDGFFHGMRHAAKVVDSNRRGQSSRYSHAIRSEMAALKLMADGARSNDNVHRPAPVYVGFHEPVSMRQLIGEVLAGIALYVMPFGALWLIYAYTGELVTF